MTLEERDQLSRFLQMLSQAQAGVKDPEAEGLIRDAVGRQPDAAYLLVQRVLQLEHALRDATRKPGFVGDANAWGRAPIASQPSTAAPVQTSIPMTTQQTPAAASSWGSGLLGTVATTAAGVVAGSLLFQGIGSLFGHHGNAQAADHAAIPPGGGTLVETDYTDAGLRATADPDGGYVADDFDSGGGDQIDPG